MVSNYASTIIDGLYSVDIAHKKIVIPIKQKGMKFISNFTLYTCILTIHVVRLLMYNSFNIYGIV